MKKQQASVVRRHISLRSQEHEAVQMYADALGLDFSSALRVIVNEWVRLRAQQEQVVAEALRAQAAKKYEDSSVQPISA